MDHGPVLVTRLSEKLLPQDHRVITRYLDLYNRPRIRAMVKRIMSIPEERVPS
jgi:hypothetical protein